MSGARFGSLLEGLPTSPQPDELFTTLAALPGSRIERIVSTGQSSPDGFWYDQDWDEFVLLVAGAATLQVEGEDDRLLSPATGRCCPPAPAIASPPPPPSPPGGRPFGWRSMPVSR